ncbi:bifunctional preprotein translocase subunit SecD/SecF [Mesomycoplasma dispar]|uniref:Bifunctional preprotein translocase subunit SecD/SecF n=1 Tax=Mesomycoplasma dispar TaxID=86660 RepID=A0AAJ5NRW3_9BACT|nr:protein translocase subunit SecDF [Mesomycoplasma dispar]AJR12011.1 preprotein translocase subunit SecD [Mesomycoplasma dispar]VEU61331.1 bifunctional preprotein translocase subunit SecD/SecF [Mesomycoplasma dispar]
MKFRTFFAKLFSLNSWKRFFLAFLTFSLLGSGIFLVSNYYISRNINRSIEYGGGAEVLVQVKTLDGKIPSAKVVNEADAAIFQRLTGGANLNGTSVFTEGEGRIRISRNKISNNRELENFIQEIVNKPVLTITDTNTNPLFFDGKFDKNLTLKNGDETNWVVPFAPGSAVSQPNPQNPASNQVLIELKDNKAQLEWSKATEYISKLGRGRNRILIWSNIAELKKMAKEKFPKEWAKANENIYNFVHVGERTTPQFLPGNKILRPELKKFQFDAKRYLISDATVTQALNGKSFVITGRFSPQEAKQLALDINYGTADYKLDFLSASFVSKTKSDSAFIAGWVAIGLAIAIISLFLIVNYGLLGALATISLALYVFLTLLFFTIVRGEYSPITISALVVGIGMNIDANVISFELFKSRIYNGSSVMKANYQANRSSFNAILDSNITTLIAALVLFFFGTKNVKSFSITLIFSIIFTLIVTIGFTKFFTNFVLKTNFFQNNKKLWLLGIKNYYLKKYERGYNSIYSRIDYEKIYKYSRWLPLVLFLGSIIVFAIFAGIYKSVGAGFNLAIDFSGGTNLLIESSNSSYDLITKEKAEKIIGFLNSQDINKSNSTILLNPLNENGTIFNIEVKTKLDLSAKLASLNSTIQNNFSNIRMTNYSISNEEAQKLIFNAILSVGIALIFVTIFTLIRFKWTFSLAIIFSLLFNVLMVICAIIITRIQISQNLVVAILTLIGYTVNDTIVVFDRVKARFNEINHSDIYKLDKIKEISTSAIKETAKRSVYTSLTTILTIAVLMIFYQSIDIIFSLTMLIGIIIGTYSSLFIATRIWVKLEWYRNRKKEKRINSKYWNVQKIYEQTFANINDYEK